MRKLQLKQQKQQQKKLPQETQRFSCEAKTFFFSVYKFQNPTQSSPSRLKTKLCTVPLTCLDILTGTVYPLTHCLILTYSQLQMIRCRKFILSALLL